MEDRILFPEYNPAHNKMVCIDSDGCAFDTMEIKHKECFCPATVQMWDLQPISKYVREAWEYGNLYSKYRGCSRFHELAMVFDWLAQRPEVKRIHFKLPDIHSFREWLNTTSVINNESLLAEAELTGDRVLRRAYEWSIDCNRRIAEMVHNIPPFPLVRESLARLREEADIVIVSATARDALEREWEEHDLMLYVHQLCAQEDGGKRECISALKHFYALGNILMLGDAPGDYNAAKSNDALFFPIRPGEEMDSWQEFYTQGMEHFLRGEFSQSYENELLQRFENCLPTTPPWENKNFRI